MSPTPGPESNPLLTVTRFAHESEQRFARILDFYGVLWEYEPVEFALDWDEDGRPMAGFRPDFWLPEPGLFVEVTTLNQRLVTKKNGKVRRMAQLYPEVRVTLCTSGTPWPSWPSTAWPARAARRTGIARTA